MINFKKWVRLGIDGKEFFFFFYILTIKSSHAKAFKTLKNNFNHEDKI